jgi:PTH1 family peptidyl-tRNA hydrolase
MTYYLVGLGNPGEEYENTRHNTGRIILETLASKWEFLEWETKSRLKLKITDGKVGKKKVVAILPNTFMNLSGTAVKPYITSKKKAERLIVIYDDIDLPLGRFKISKGRGDGGHNGIASIIKSLKTKDFIRIRVGVSPKVRGSNTPKKPKGEKKVLDYLLGEFRKQELVAVELLTKDIQKAIESIFTEGLDMAMNQYNRKE